MTAGEACSALPLNRALTRHVLGKTITMAGKVNV